MPPPNPPQVSIAIVDYGLGNLFSVRQACEHVGMRASITASSRELLAADGVILPGVGAFGDAMAELRRLDLVSPLRDLAAAQKPLVGICLGMQLLMTESHEFGQHQGLGIIEGPVVPFQFSANDDPRMKVPQVGWNRVFPPHGVPEPPDVADADPWRATPLAGVTPGEFMYFVHSYYAQPQDSDLTLARTQYGDVEFCSSLRRGNVFATQFHPERSGPQGLRIYRELAGLIGQQLAPSPTNKRTPIA